MSGSHALDDVRQRTRDEEFARALRALLRRPLLTAAVDADAFRLVRRHADELRAWLAHETGWRLYVDAEVARLRKTPADLGDGTRPARSGRGQPAFGRRRYVLLCLALAALERAEAQVTLGWVAEQVVTMAGDDALADAGIAFTLERRDERSDLVAVVRLLLAQGVLAHVAGDAQDYLDERGDALYDVDRRVLSTVLATRRGPSLIAAGDLEGRLAALAGETDAEAPLDRDAPAADTRRRLARRLLDDPVVYDADLDEAEREYLRTQRTNLARRLAGPAGLEPELRAEGLALLDPTGEATDQRMPEEGTDGHATLLLAEHLAAAAGDGEAPDGRAGEAAGGGGAGDREAVPLADLDAHVAALAREHAGYWRKGADEPDHARAICRTAVERLAALRLVDVDEDGVRPRPALARYAAAEATVSGPRQDTLTPE